MECRLPIPENERVSLKEQNDLALARAGESENHAQDIGGALPAAPCSASDAARPEQGGENLSDENDNKRDELSTSGQIRKAHRLIQSLQNRVTYLERQIQGLA